MMARMMGLVAQPVGQEAELLVAPEVGPEAMVETEATVGGLTAAWSWPTC
jgi:hypothetical protein